MFVDSVSKERMVFIFKGHVGCEEFLLTFKNEGKIFSRNVANPHPTTMGHIPEDPSPQSQLCENLQDSYSSFLGRKYGVSELTHNSHVISFSVRARTLRINDTISLLFDTAEWHKKWFNQTKSNMGRLKVT